MPSDTPHQARRDSLGVKEERDSRVVELRLFGGLSHEEAAHVLDVSVATVRRDCSVARSWLYPELRREARHDA